MALPIVVTAATEGVVAVTFIVGLILVDGPAASGAGREVVVKAVRTDRLALVVVDVFIPDPLVAILADDGASLETAFT